MRSRDSMPGLMTWLGILTTAVIAIASYSLQVELISGAQFVDIIEAFTPVALLMAGAGKLQSLSTSVSSDDKALSQDKNDVQVEEPSQNWIRAQGVEEEVSHGIDKSVSKVPPPIERQS